MPEPVIIVPYDQKWPEAFDVVAAVLRRALGQQAVAIHHVGSTSVPGLAAKPIIDIDVVIDDDTAVTDIIARLATEGYCYEGEQGIPGRHAFKQPSTLPRHHCYVCRRTSQELARHLAFRDALRASPETRVAYECLKRELAELHRDDRAGYSEGKTGFIETLLRGLIPRP